MHRGYQNNASKMRLWRKRKESSCLGNATEMITLFFYKLL
jgi:hypothetical protein